MHLPKILTPSFRSLAATLGLHAEVFEGRLVIWAPMWKQALSINSVFCDALVSNRILTQEQMEHAAQRYRLGASNSRGVIFWQIDHEGRIHDGKIMYYRTDCHRDKSHNPTWVSALLARREAALMQTPHHPLTLRHTTSHCLFGLHLLDVTNRPTVMEPMRDTPPVAVVEAEKTAVIMSEIYPDYLWLAAGGLTQLQPDKFRPLRGHRLILFPDTDPTGEAYKLWYETAQMVQQQLFWEGSPPIHVSDLLERHATEDQKQRKIDLADYYLESVSHILTPPNSYTFNP